MKQALCVNAVPLADGVHALSPEFFIWASPVLRARPECETDETMYQIIPYITVTNSEHKLYTYVRGKAGDEGRLHDKLSVGLGGHVDAAPLPGGLLALLQAEAARELNEETGILVGNPGVFQFAHTIVDHSDEVGRVHLGLLTNYTVDDTQLISAEDKVIEQGSFRSLENLYSPEVFPYLEKWSQHVVAHLYNQLMDL